MQIKQAAETERLDKQLAADEKKMETDAAQRKKDADDQLKQVQADKEKQDEANKAAEAAIMVKKAKENGQKKIRKGKEKMKEKTLQAKTDAAKQKLHDKYDQLVKERAIKDPAQRKLRRHERHAASLVHYDANHLAREQRREARVVKYALEKKKREVVRHIHTAVSQANELLKEKARQDGVPLPRSLHVRMPVMGDEELAKGSDDAKDDDPNLASQDQEAVHRPQFATPEMVEDAKDAFKPGAAKEAVATAVATAANAA